MQKAQGFRHELKYGIDPFSYLVLRQRLSTVMRRDSHAGTDGRYQIVSLYFDNCCDKALREKQDGINRREKFRLRRYNDDCSALFLEKKAEGQWVMPENWLQDTAGCLYQAALGGTGLAAA